MTISFIMQVGVLPVLLLLMATAIYAPTVRTSTLVINPAMLYAHHDIMQIRPVDFANNATVVANNVTGDTLKTVLNVFHHPTINIYYCLRFA